MKLYPCGSKPDNKILKLAESYLLKNTKTVKNKPISISVSRESR